MAPKILPKNLVRPKSRSEWRSWLKKNYKKETEAWLVSPKKSSGVDRIPYNDVVEEALCFGWIDSVNKTLDKDHTVQRFTPRRKKSPYSQPNIERLRKMAENNKVMPEVLESVSELLSNEFLFPKDILAEIKKDKLVWKNYNAFNDRYKRLRVAYIDGARPRPEEFKKRLKNFITKTRDNKMISGYGGIDIYY